MSGRLSQPARSRYDLVVVGGGIHGLFAANEAARRGWSVALVERDDFGSGLSFNHQRTVHGGLRALESGRFDKALTQIRERSAWAVMAPHLLRPLPFLLPTRTSGMRSRLVLGTGLRIYDWLGRQRNAGLPDALHLPASGLVDPADVTRVFPGVDRDGLTGGARWYDYQVRYPDRLNWLVALAARRAGAHLWNHVEATSLVLDKRRVSAVVVRDRLTGEVSERRASNVLICAGGGVRRVHEAFGLPPGPLLLRACNILVDRKAPAVALAARGASGRMLTATPWSDRWLIGTFQSAEPADEAVPPASDVADMLADANAAFGLNLTRQDLCLVHAGLTPATRSRGRLELLPEPVIADHSRLGCAGVVTLVGVKFTTARLAAVAALDRLRLAGRAQQSAEPVALPVQPLPHGVDAGALAALQAASVECDVTLDDDVMAHLVDWYATEAPDVVRVATASGSERLSPDSPVIAGEIVYAATHGAARRLADAVLRRTRLGATGQPRPEALAAAALAMSTVTGWSVAEREAEIAHVLERYAHAR